MNCFNAFSLLRSSKYECNTMTTTTLKCGHEINNKCSLIKNILQSPEKYNCSETVERECPNFDVCANTVNTPCSISAPVYCTTKTKWICVKCGFECQLDQCSKGDPSHCPSCIKDLIENEIDQVKNQLESKKISSSSSNQQPIGIWCY